MDYKVWYQHMLHDKEAQKLLEEKIDRLVELYFKEKSDYATEKFIKSFGEGLIYLENNLVMNRKLHALQLEENIMYHSGHQQKH